MLKKNIYLLSTMALLGVLSWFLHQILMLSLPFEQVTLIIVSILCLIGGYGLGQYRWRIVYIEKRRYKVGKKKKIWKKFKTWINKGV